QDFNVPAVDEFVTKYSSQKKSQSDNGSTLPVEPSSESGEIPDLLSGGRNQEKQPAVTGDIDTKTVDDILSKHKDLDWVQRLYQKNTPSIPTPPDIEGYQPGQTSTHLMGSNGE